MDTRPFCEGGGGGGGGCYYTAVVCFVKILWSSETTPAISFSLVRLYAFFCHLIPRLHTAACYFIVFFLAHCKRQKLEGGGGEPGNEAVDRFNKTLTICYNINTQNPTITGLPPRRSLLPTPIASTHHHLCMKLIHTCSKQNTHLNIITLQKKLKDVGMVMCVKRMSSRSCLGHFSRFAIPLH